MAHRGLLFRLRPDHEAGGIAQGNHRQPERCCLPGAGLGKAHDIVAFKRQRDRFLLDRGWVLDVLFRQFGGEFGREAQVFKRHNSISTVSLV